jgi:hypothetical protein
MFLFVFECFVVTELPFKSMHVVKLVIARFDGYSNLLENCASDDCIAMGIYITRLPLDLRSMRLKALYCSTVAALLVKRHCFAFQREIELRHYLTDVLADWIEQHLVSCF